MDEMELTGTWTLLKRKLRDDNASLTSEEEEILATIQRAVGRGREEIRKIIKDMNEPAAPVHLRI